MNVNWCMPLRCNRSDDRAKKIVDDVEYYFYSHDFRATLVQLKIDFSFAAQIMWWLYMQPPHNIINVHEPNRSTKVDIGPYFMFPIPQKECKIVQSGILHSFCIFCCFVDAGNVILCVCFGKIVMFCVIGVLFIVLFVLVDDNRAYRANFGLYFSKKLAKYSNDFQSAFISLFCIRCV